MNYEEQKQIAESAEANGDLYRAAIEYENLAEWESSFEKKLECRAHAKTLWDKYCPPMSTEELHRRIDRILNKQLYGSQ